MKKYTPIAALIILLIAVASVIYWSANKENGLNRDFGPPITISPESLNNARTNMYFLQTLRTTGFTETERLSWTVASGTLPTGLILETDTRGCLVPENCPAVQTSRGLLSGTITGEPGIYQFTVEVTNGIKTGDKSYELVVNN